MPYILKNKDLEIYIDGPEEGYHFSRFDWTGKITDVRFQNISLASIETQDNPNESILGKGFYNEFGIDTALGFEETEIGGWFHKIGIGLLKKTDAVYAFDKKYEIQPAKFAIKKGLNKLVLSCQAKLVNGYAYTLIKTIELQENRFSIHYSLENKGEKAIITDEYVHNFLAFNQNAIDNNYVLKFPFILKPQFFGKSVNPEQKVIIGPQTIQFKATPTEQFFFSNLSGHESIEAKWELHHLAYKIGISESGSFQTAKVNLWGGEQVVSPELFFSINIQSGQSKEWIRQYKIFKIKE